jgi:cytochrome c oxidase subunit 3
VTQTADLNCPPMSEATTLAHHFDSHAQQFAAAKLGMWIFLGTELLMFGGLFCLYAVFRANQPEIYEWGHHFLDAKLGAINTVVLLVSSFTMAWAVRAAQLKNRTLLFVLLLFTLLCGFGFMGIKYIEYMHKISNGLTPGASFSPNPDEIAHVFTLPEKQLVEFDSDAAMIAAGAQKYGQTCIACHGAAGTGVQMLVPSLLTSTFVQSQDVEQLAALIEVGRLPDDPQSMTGRLMPAKGGNMLLTADDMQALAAFVKSLTVGQPLANAGQDDDPRFSAAMPPPNAHQFFSIYYMMTGLHGVHVLVGMALITYLLACTFCHDFATGHITKVDLIGLYWHIVDVIWIFLFPLLYLID